jgi:hypothetical protein
MRPTVDPTLAANFPADRFRQKIRATMQLGIPTDEELRPTFRWSPTRTHSGPVSRAGTPYSFGATPVSTDQPDPVQVPCGVKYGSRTYEGTALGEFKESEAELTLLDVDYEEVADADYVSLGGNLYRIEYRTVSSLQEVQIWRLMVRAVDET